MRLGGLWVVWGRRWMGEKRRGIKTRGRSLMEAVEEEAGVPISRYP